MSLISSRQSMSAGQSKVASSTTEISSACLCRALVPNSNWHEEHMLLFVTHSQNCLPSANCKRTGSLFCLFFLVFSLFVLSYYFSLLCDSSSSCPQNMSLLGWYAQGLSPAWKSLQLNVLYTCLKRSVCLTEEKRACACLCHVCGMASSRDPASNWGLSEFCETPGGRVERDRDRESCHQKLSNSTSLLVNLQSSESLQRCMSVLKKYAQVGPLVSIKWWEHSHQGHPYCTTCCTSNIELSLWIRILHISEKWTCSCCEMLMVLCVQVWKFCAGDFKIKHNKLI